MVEAFKRCVLTTCYGHCSEYFPAIKSFGWILAFSTCILTVIRLGYLVKLLPNPYPWIFTNPILADFSSWRSHTSSVLSKWSTLEAALAGWIISNNKSNVMTTVARWKFQKFSHFQKKNPHTSNMGIKCKVFSSRMPKWSLFLPLVILYFIFTRKTIIKQVSYKILDSFIRIWKWS